MDPDLYPRLETENYLEGGLPLEAEQFPQKRAANAALYASALLLFIALATTAGAWFLHLRVRGTALSIYAPVCTVLVLFSLFSAFWAFTAKRKAATGAQPSALLSLIVFMGGISLGAFFIVSAAGLVAARCTHAAALFAGRNAKVNSGPGAKGGVGIDGLIFRALSAFSVAATCCLAFVVFAAFSFMRNRLQTTKLAMLIALPGAAVFSLFAVVTVLRSQALSETLAAHLPPWTSATCLVVGLLAAVALLALVNALCCLLRVEAVHFMCGVGWILICLTLLLGGSLLLRDVRRSNCGGGLSCRAAAAAVHAERYLRLCPAGKYLGAGQTCRKVDLVTQWETGAGPAFLNPRCCSAAASIATQPFFSLALCLLAAAVTTAVAAGANLAQTDLAEEDRADARHFSVVDLLTLVAVALAIGGLGLFCLRTARAHKPVSRPMAALTDLPLAVQNSENTSLCYSLGKGSIPVLECKNGKSCQFAVGLLVLNGQFEPGEASPTAVSTAARDKFFAGNVDASSDFRLLKGPADVLTRQLTMLRVCQASPTLPHAVIARVLPVGSLDALSPMSATGLSSLRPASTCAGSCDAILVAHAPQTVTLQGRLLVRDDKDRLVPYGVPEAGVELTFGFYAKSGFVKLAAGSYDTQGHFRIDAACPAEAAYVGVLRVTDPHKHYLGLELDVAVSPPSASGRELRIGDVTLTTASGKGCKGADLHRMLSCFASQRSASRHLEITLAEAFGGRRARGALRYTIRRGYSHTGKIVAGPSTTRSARITAKLPVGYYTLEVQGGGYATRAEPVLLDRDRKVTVALHPASDRSLRLVMETSAVSRDADYDLGLSLRAADGSECTVSTVSQRCPNMHKTIEPGPNGKEYEIIEVTRAVPGTYLAFVSRGESYGTCAAAPAGAATRHLSSGYYAATQKYNIFTSWGWGGAAYAPGLGNAGLGSVESAGEAGTAGFGGISLAPNSVPHAFLPQVWVQARALRDVLQSGRVINFPALFSAVKAGTRRGDGALSVPELGEYFSFLGNSTDRAQLFVRALPILYPNEGGSLAAGAQSLLAGRPLGKDVEGEVHSGLSALNAGRFVFDSAAAAALFAALRGRKSSVSLPAQSTDGPVRTLPPLEAAVADRQSGPMTYVPGIGEEPYLLLKNSTSMVDDVEVGTECDPALPLRPLFVPYTDKSLVGVELCDQIGVIGADERLPTCAGQPAKPQDLRGALPLAARIPLAPNNYTSTFFTELVPTSNSEVSQYLKDDLGRVHVSFTNGTVIYTDLFEQVRRKQSPRTEKKGDALRQEYDDGSVSTLYANGTSVHVGPRNKYIRHMVPVTAQKTVTTTTWLEAVEGKVREKTSRKAALKAKVRARAKRAPTAAVSPPAEVHLSSPAKNTTVKAKKPKAVKVKKTKVKAKTPKAKPAKQVPRLELHPAPPRKVTDYTTLFCFTGTGPATVRPLSSVTQRSPSPALCDQRLSPAARA